jgi:glycosyltransferase involved in cell wall biosynthesis
MKILVHDYSGHAFTVQLARWFAEQGHEVQYWYSADIESPRGTLFPQEDDPKTFRIRGITLGVALAKYNFLQRFWQEEAYGRRIAKLSASFGPDITLSNAPPAVQNALRKSAQDNGGKFVYWLQDIYSAALAQVARQKFPFGGSTIGKISKRYEFSVLHGSDHVVCISEDFVPHCRANGVTGDHCTVIQNWASLCDIPVLPHDNTWSRAQNLHDRFVFLFSGTLGLKHNPGVLTALAQAVRDVPEAAVVVVSQGLGRKWLERKKAEAGIDNLYLFDFQPHETLPQVLATGDVLMAILEPFAGELSVPSKILAYLCAGRPLLTALPASNLSARILLDAGAGIVVQPGDNAGFVAAASSLMRDEVERRALGAAGRAYAERAFDINGIGNRFLSLFASLRSGAGRHNAKGLQYRR